MASLMMFGFPIIFFFLFGVLIDSDFDLPDTKIAVDQNLSESPLVGKLAEVDGVDISYVRFEIDSVSEQLEEGGYSAFLSRKDSEQVAFIDSSQQRAIRLVLRAAQFEGQTGTEPFLVEEVDVESAFVRFAIPGLFAMALLQLMIFATAMPLMTERASGTWRLFSTLPVSNYSILAGEGASRFAIATIQITLLYLLTVLFVDITLEESLAPLVGMSVLSAIMCIVLGFAIGGSIPDERWGIHVLTFMNLYMLFFGNIMSPMSEIEGLKYLVLINPITYASEGIRWALTGTQGFVSPGVCVVAMTVWTLVALLVVKYKFRFETKTTL